MTNVPQGNALKGMFRTELSISTFEKEERTRQVFEQNFYLVRDKHSKRNYLLLIQGFVI